MCCYFRHGFPCKATMLVSLENSCSVCYGKVTYSGTVFMKTVTVHPWTFIKHALPSVFWKDFSILGGSKIFGDFFHYEENSSMGYVACVKDCMVGSICPEVFCEKGVLKNFTKFKGKHLCWRPFFNQVVGRSSTLLKNGRQHRCFPSNFVKFLRIPFSQNTSGQLLLHCVFRICSWLINFLQYRQS